MDSQRNELNTASHHEVSWDDLDTPGFLREPLDRERLLRASGSLDQWWLTRYRTSQRQTVAAGENQ